MPDRNVIGGSSVLLLLLLLDLKLGGKLNGLELDLARKSAANAALECGQLLLQRI